MKYINKKKFILFLQDAVDWYITLRAAKFNFIKESQPALSQEEVRI